MNLEKVMIFLKKIKIKADIIKKILNIKLIMKQGKKNFKKLKKNIKI